LVPVDRSLNGEGDGAKLLLMLDGLQTTLLFLPGQRLQRQGVCAVNGKIPFLKIEISRTRN
jgi:hypothetical protein